MNNNTMMLYQLIFIFLMASMDFQCHAFKEIRRRPTLATTTKYDYHRHHRKAVSVLPLFSIRGGDINGEYDEDEYDDDIANEFISIFESELAEIRHEAEREAEEEMQKLRSLIERRAMLEEAEKESDQYDNESDFSDESYENETVEAAGTKDGPTDNKLAEEEKSEVSETTAEEVADHLEIKSPAPDHEISTVSGESDLEVITDDEEEDIEEVDGKIPEADDKPSAESDTTLSDGETVEAVEEIADETGIAVEENNNIPSDEYDEDLQHDNLEVPADTIEISDDLVESDMEDEEASPSLDTHSKMEDDERTQDDSFQTKPKLPKKKKRSSKTSKSKGKGKKKRVKRSKESQFSDMGVTTVLAHSEDELTELPQSGIWFYLRSDLGRAICLFTATILLALLTQRMQHQLEAEGN